MQSNATAKRFLWIELAIYWYVIRNELYSFKIVLEFYFLRNREKSVANSWEREIGREIVRLTTKSWDLASVRFWTSVSLDLGVNFYTWAFSTLTPITTRVDIKAIRWQPNAQNNVHTTWYQNTHQACYRVCWPGGLMHQVPILHFCLFTCVSVAYSPRSCSFIFLWSTLT